MNPDQALRDPLTGAYHWSALQARLGEEIERSRRYSLPLSLLLIDLDRFNRITAALPPARVDQVLCDFTRIVQTQIRGADLLFRHGENGFCLLLPNTGKPDALILANRLLEKTAATRFEGEPPLSFTLSIGCASYPDGGRPAESLLDRATRRLFQAHRNGTGKVESEDALGHAALYFDLTACPPEREPALEALRVFLSELPKKKRGLLRVSGPWGAGKPDFLIEVAREAAERGFVALRVNASQALRGRAYGALADLTDLPDPNEEELFLQALFNRVAQGRQGLVVVVDNLPELDCMTLELLRRLLYASEIPVAALAYSADRENLTREPLLRAPFQAEIDLRAFSRPGIALWLREVLQWEPPDALVDWLFQETEGLPANLRRAMAYLGDSELLHPTEGGWALSSGYRSLPLAEKLRTQRAKETSRSGTLPEPALAFIGRAAELRRAKQAVAAGNLVTISGPAGAGKTRLALQAALELQDRFWGGVVLLPVGIYCEADELAARAVRAFGFPVVEPDGGRETLIKGLSALEDDALLVLDGPGFPAGVEDLLQTVRQECPRVHLLLTAYSPLGLEGEEILELGPFPLPPSDYTGMGYSAARLFLQAARRGWPDFELRPMDGPALRRIFQAVGVLPLGIELAAAWAPLLQVQELARGLEFFLSVQPQPTDQAGVHPGLMAALECFWGLLSEEERRGLRALSVFAAGFDWAAARHVAGVSLFFLDGLASKGFLTRTGERHYAFHDLVRQDAARRLAALPREYAQAQERYAELELGKGLRNSRI